MPPEAHFALVSYLPEQIASCLTDIRSRLPVRDASEPHVTVLPRRPLKVGVDAASSRALDVLARFTTFDVKLDSVRAFEQTNVLYIDILQGRAELDQMHSALNSAELEHDEEFDYRPHLTLSGPIDDSNIARALAQTTAEWEAAYCPREFIVDGIVCLRESPELNAGLWEQIWCHRLTTASKDAKLAAAASRLGRG